MNLPRAEVKKSDCWNVEMLYPSMEAWEKDYQSLAPKSTPHWPEIEQFKGQLVKGAQQVKNLFDTLYPVHRKLNKLFIYAHLRHDEDITIDRHRAAFQQAYALMHAFASETAWIEPELLGLPEETYQNYLSDPQLAEYRFDLEKSYRMRAHTLPAEQEQLLALAAQPLTAAHKAFSALNDADLKFGTAENQEGVPKELTHASVSLYLHGRDRALRKNAFVQYHQSYKNYENTLCELLQGQAQAHFFQAKAKRYTTCLEAALDPNNIDTQVYHSLIEAVSEGTGSLHKAMELRKRVLGLDTLHLYDMHVPLTESLDMNLSYEEAEKLVVDSVHPLGKEYQDILRKGLLEERWVDRYENANKRSGAYSSGCYDSCPYILMNYKGLLRDVFTLAHEAGHSMHTFYSHRHQPYHMSSYPIFLAEVASTFNEELLMRHLLKNAKTDEEKIYLLNQKIEDIRATLFRQTQFAEFELKIHTFVEQGVPLTPQLLRQEYRQLLEKYYGPAVAIDEAAESEWSRIPHFYYQFYVYQYATGISAALALADRVCGGGKSECQNYINFLKSGGSAYPLDTLQSAGVNLRTPEAVRLAIRTFDRLVTELEKVIQTSKDQGVEKVSTL